MAVNTSSDDLPPSWVQDDNNTDPLAALVHEVESSAGSCTNALKQLELNQLSDFVNKLEKRLGEHDKDIERTCNFHYQGFVESITELLQVKDDANQLRLRMSDISQEAIQSAETLHVQCKELEMARRAVTNVELASEGLQLCLPVLDTYVKLKEQIESKRFYPALKTLEHLEHNMVPLVSKFAFCEVLQEEIPQMRVNIKEAARGELTDFLVSVRKYSAHLGALAMKQTETSMSWGGEQTSERPVQSQPVVTSGRVSRSRSQTQGSNMSSDSESGSSMTNGVESVGTELLSLQLDQLEQMSAQDLVDFSPVYRCLHIFTVLGERAEFESFYRKQRKKQCQLLLNLTQNQQETLKNYSEFFCNIVGFFVVEDFLLHGVPSMVTQAYLDDLWETARYKLEEVVRSNSDSLQEVDDLLRLKDFCLQFSQTMRAYGFEIGFLRDLVSDLGRRQQALLCDKWKPIFVEIFDKDDYTPKYLEQQEDYDALLSIYPCSRPEFDSLPFPKRLSFSNMVARVYQEVKTFIDASLSFSLNLDLSRSEVEDTVKNAANDLFSTAVRPALTHAVRKPQMTLLQLIQLSVNMDELEAVCSRLEEHVASQVGTADDVQGGEAAAGRPLATYRARLHGLSLFREVQSEAESQIYVKLNERIDEFLELAEYDWLASEQKNKVNPSDFMLDLANFLQSTFQAFTNLPPKVAQTGCLSSCKHIARSLSECVLVHSEPRMVSVGALQQLSSDLAVCENFARESPVSGLDTDTLMLAFADLRQLLDLVLRADWQRFLSEQSGGWSQEQRIYDRVSPGSAILLLEKVREAERKKSSFLATMRSQRRKELEQVVKQLKQFQSQSQMGSGGGSAAGSPAHHH